MDAERVDELVQKNKQLLNMVKELHTTLVLLILLQFISLIALSSNNLLDVHILMYSLWWSGIMLRIESKETNKST